MFEGSICALITPFKDGSVDSTAYEKLIDWKYIDALNQMYNEYFFKFDICPLLIINTNDIDFVKNKNDLEEIIEFIRTPGEGTRYFNPIKSIQ